MSTVQKAIAAAQRAAVKAARVWVRYQRDGVEVDAGPIAAVAGRSSYDQADGNGLTTQLQVRDYLILAVDVAFDGTVSEPREGDLILEQLGDQLMTWEVLSPGGGAAAWSYRDGAQSQLRLHTKLIAQEVAP
jgi:hypothetical protein